MKKLGRQESLKDDKSADGELLLIEKADWNNGFKSFDDLYSFHSFYFSR